MSANNVYDFEKEFHLKFGCDPLPCEYWKAATDAAEEKFNSTAQSGPTNNGSTSPAEIAARAVVSHWDEFGPEYGFDEQIDLLRKALQLRACR